MKYLTPDLLARFRSLDDTVAEVASAEWQRQCEAYTKRLKEIRTSLSPGARRLLRRYQFHDAKVLSIAVDEVPFFSFLLERDDSTGPEGKKRLELRYRLVGGVGQGLAIFEHKSLAGDGKPFGWWLYDEFDVSKGEVPAMTHSILLTGGWEIRLTFFSVSCRRIDIFCLPTDEQGVVDPKLARQWMPFAKNALTTT